MQSLSAATGSKHRAIERFTAEVDFAWRMADSQNKQDEWQPLIAEAVSLVVEGLGGGGDAEALVAKAEAHLAPLAKAAREYVIYCAGHAHIDMNWMWTWPETVSVTYDTFSTMDKLMDEFPEFHFTQSQASVYHLTRQYAPDLFERIKKRVAEGRWDVTASQWVEGDKNMASGEILARHLLYTRRWLKDTLGLPYEACKIDWEPDTFGHCWTLPGILKRGGVSRYYHHRANGPRLAGMASGQMSQLFWWEGKDGSRVLAYDDSPNGYNGEITPWMTHLLFAMERNTGLKRLLWVYGVGDHGGGPTRRHLRAAQDMNTWPIWPQVKLTTTDDFFSAVEADIDAKGIELPVHKDELNFVFEGCYTSESRIKFANRKGECDLVDTEVVALLAGRAAGITYPAETLAECWRRAMFLQFHDILPGSGVKETVEHAMGQFQENLANTGMIRAKSLRAFAEKVNTRRAAGARGAGVSPAMAGEMPAPRGTDMSLGAGVGNGAWWSGMSTLGAGEAGVDPFLVFNPAPFTRDDLVTLKVWNRPLQDGAVIVRDSAGKVHAGQVIERGDYWGHSFAVVAVPGEAIPAMGYRTYVVEPGNGGEAGGAYTKELGRPLYGLGYVQAQFTSPLSVGNEFLEFTICPRSGGIVSLVDKGTGQELLKPGSVLGTIEREQEAPHGMTAWQLGPIVDSVQPLANGVLEVVHQGPNVAAIRLSGKHNDSTYRLTIALASGSRQIDFQLDVNWLERGDPATGVPALRASFPIAVENGKATFEIASGSIERPADGEEAPALNWVDLTGANLVCDDRACLTRVVGATLLNDSKYGHQVSKDAIRLTLLRSSYDPDPLPELGAHSIRFALVPNVDLFDPAAATRAGYAFNHPLIPVNTTLHEGEFEPEASGMEILTPNIAFSALKKAEDQDGVIVRIYETAGLQTEARIRLSDLIAKPNSPAAEVDLLEQPLEGNSARMEGDVLAVQIAPYGIASVLVMHHYIGANAI
jgi:alpha-mannosidase